MLEDLSQAINDVFLGGRFEARPLYLVLDNQGRDQLASTLGVPAEEVEEHCCQLVGRALARSGDPYSPFEHEVWKWIMSGRKSRPPFTPLLFVLSHAAEEMVSDGEFTAGNYYDRLSALVNVPPGRLSQHGSSTEPIWRAFNNWLADNDFAYGHPTARAINSFRYVGIAMSQAIVREADRQRFHLMFEKYGFSNTDDVSEAEIEQYISTWIRSTQPTRQLKEAWKKTELRPRICEAAKSELEDWQAEIAGSNADGGPGTSRLSLALSYRHDFLGRSVALYLGKGTSTEPLALTMGEGKTLELSNTTFAGFATLEPRSAIPLARTLLHGLELRRDDQLAFTWSGRPAIPLSRSDQGYWSEVSRVSLGVEQVVLVRDDRKIREAIESALEEAADPGFTVATPAALKGLPEGWVLYEKVIIRRALDELKGFESVLSPVGDSSSLGLEGGLRLGRGLWHLWRPPIARFEAGKAGVALVAWEGTSPGEEEACSASADTTSVSLPLDACVPASGNIYLEGRVGKATVATATLLFRSANRPRPLDRQARTEVAYSGFISTSTGAAAESPPVRGLFVPDGTKREFDTARLEYFRDFDFAPAAEAQDDEPSFNLASREALESIKGLSPSEVMALPCAVRGLHRLRYETVPPGAPRYAPVDVECLDCGMTYIHRRKPQGSQGGNRRGRLHVPASRDPSNEIARREIDVDLWLDGACFLGSGSAATFETFAASSEVDTWRAGVAMRDLAWLGHLDVETSSTFRARNWSVGAPVLSFTGETTAVFAGFRCNSLADKIGQVVSGSGGRLVEHRRENHPAILGIEGLAREQLVDALSAVRDPHGREIRVVSDVPMRLLSFLADKPVIASIFRPVSLGVGLPVQKFDVGANRWRNVDHATAPGAYKVAGAGTSYVFRGSSGRAFSAPHELVKLAAARAEGLAVHAYDQSTRQFRSRLGCEPVGLLARALVASSGELPLLEAGTTIFKDVSPGVAAGVLHFLYEGELPA